MTLKEQVGPNGTGLIPKEIYILTNEITIRSGKLLAVGDTQLEIIDRGIPIAVPNLFVEHRHSNGMIAISLATVIADGTNKPEAHVCTRLRMDLIFAQALRDQLDELITNSMTPLDKSKAN